MLLTTHDLTDIEQLCKRVMVIDHGRLMYDGALAGLHEVGESERTLVVDLERELPPIDGIAGARTVQVGGAAPVAGLPGVGESAAPLVARIADGVSAGGPVGAGAGHRGRHRPYVHGPLRPRGRTRQRVGPRPARLRRGRRSRCHGLRRASDAL